MIKAVCFDLDGTLLPLDIDVFCRYYFGKLAARMAPYGYDPRAFVSAILKGSRAMYQNDGTRTNEQVFWDSFREDFGDGVLRHVPVFDAFYKEEFDSTREVCGFDPEAAATVAACQSRGLVVAIATNPLFPEIATRKRLTFAGIDPQTVAFYTTFEDHCYCKPNEGYYREVAEKLGLLPEECLMVGNDVVEDMSAARIGMHVFLLVNEHLINPKGEDISAYPHGGFSELLAYVDTLCKA